MLYPITPGDWLAVQDRSTLCGWGAWPVPVSVSTVGEFEALLKKVRLPLAAPLAVRLPLREVLVFTTTLPKLSVPGETESWPAAAPVPDRAMLRVEFDASETIARLPLTAPVEVGANLAVNV